MSSEQAPGSETYTLAWFFNIPHSTQNAYILTSAIADRMEDTSYSDNKPQNLAEFSTTLPPRYQIETSSNQILTVHREGTQHAIVADSRLEITVERALASHGVSFRKHAYQPLKAQPKVSIRHNAKKN